MYWLKHIPTKQCGKEDNENFGHVGWQEVLDWFLNIWEDLTSFFYGNDNCRKVIIGKNHIWSSLRNLCTCNSHTDTDISCLKWRRIINPITCHGNNLAIILPSLNDTNLVFRRHTRIDRVLFEDFLEFFIRKLIKLSSSKDMIFRIIWIDNTKTLSNCFCCILVVTCDHDWTNPRFFSDTDSFCCFWTFWVNHTYQTWENQIRLNNCRFQGGNIIRCLISHHQDTKSLFCQVLISCKDSLFIFICDRTDLTIDFNTSHTFEQLVRRTFNGYKVCTIRFFVDSRHELTVRVKWQFCHTRLWFQDVTHIKIVVQTKLNKSCFCWIPDQFTIRIHLCIIGKVHNTKGCIVSTKFRRSVLQLTVCIDFFNSHLVHG